MLKANHRKEAAAACLIFLVTLCIIIIFHHLSIQAYDEKQGVVNGTYVNVRTGAGTSNDKLTYQGKNVQLNVGDSVTVIGEEKAGDGAVWYKVKFDYTNNAELTGYIHNAYVDINNNTYTNDADFEKYLTAQGFPESYKVKLRQLHQKYPKWVFVADHLSYDWEEAVKNESVIGRSLVSKNSISSWKSLETGSYNWSTGQWATFDGGSWVAASKEYIEYCMDPRNFLDEKYIFQFEMLSFNASIHKEENVEDLLENTFMHNSESITGKSYTQTFMEAAAQSGVSPYHLAARVIQEVGSAGKSGGVTGYYAPSTGNIYKDLYNFYNIGAYAASGRGAVENGLIYASKTDEATLRPWNTKYKAIVGGAIYIGNGYINIGQDTIYYEKFDFVGTPYTHQYMTNVQAPKSEAIRMSNAYTDTMKQNIGLVFKIPVFKNMPSESCYCPSKDGSPNNILEDLSVSGFNLTPTFNKFTQEYDLVVPNNVATIRISATAIDSSATISGAGKVSINVGTNSVNVVVTAGNGDKRTYKLNVVRSSEVSSIGEPASTKNNTTTTQQATTQPATTAQPTTAQPTTGQPATTQQPTTTQMAVTPTYSTTYNKINDTYLTGIDVGTTVDQLKASFKVSNCSVAVCNSSGGQISAGKVGTGVIVKINNTSGNTIKQYICVIYGDINGDGAINLVDMLYQRRHILGIGELRDEKLIAGDINKKGGVDLVDMLYVKRYILGIGSISQ